METKQLIHSATKSQIDYYCNKLYPLQDKVLEKCNMESIYLTGGTALTRFYYNHRFSEDLDFFYDGYRYPQSEFAIIVSQIIYSIEKYFDKIELTINSEKFKRYFLVKDDVNLKVEFIFEHYRTIGEKKLVDNYYIDTKENICTNKITAITDRKTVKDFFDLYFLLEELKFEDVIKWSEYKVVPLDYEGMIISFKNTFAMLEGKILTTKSITDNELKKFIQNLITKMVENAE